MCFFLFPRAPGKRRQHLVDTSEEDLIPRKRTRATHYSARPAKYEPLRGHGVKRDAQKGQQPAVLRGSGAKREQPHHDKHQRLLSPMPAGAVAQREPRTPAKSSSRASTTPKRRSSEHHGSTSKRRNSQNDGQKRRSDSFSSASRQNRQSQSHAPEMTQRNSFYQQQQQHYTPANTAQQRYSYPSSAASSSREHPLYTNQTPNYVYSMPKCYYHDIGAVRAATSHALQESTMFGGQGAGYSRNLRRQPAFTQLRG